MEQVLTDKSFHAGSTKRLGMHLLFGIAALGLLAFSAVRVLPTPEAHFDGHSSSSFTWPMFGNDVYSDCTVGAAGDLIRAWNLEMNDSATTITDSEAITVFKSLGGSVNQGVAISALLTTWQTQGIAGNQLSSWARLDNSDVNVTQRAIDLLGGVIGEVELTRQTLAELGNGQSVTSTAPGSPSLAHALIFIGYNSKYLTAVTFGHEVQVSWTWWLKNGVAEYGVIPRLFIQAGHGPATSYSSRYLTNWLLSNSIGS